jgi:hypothetical protein
MEKILARFIVVDMTAQKYSQVINDLKAAGNGNPPGRLYHIAALESNGMIVTDVWESVESLNKFSETLIPILVKNGVTPSQPDLHPVHNIIEHELDSVYSKL